MTPAYGRRDAACVLMGRGRRVALRYRSVEGRMQWLILLDGQPVTMRQLEDEAEQYERLSYRNTDRRPR